MHHQNPVGGAVNIEFDGVGTQLDGATEGDERILRQLARCAAVGDEFSAVGHEGAGQGGCRGPAPGKYTNDAAGAPSNGVSADTCRQRTTMTGRWTPP